MRLFIAIEPPAELRERALAVTAPLRASGAEVKWLSAEQLHFTVKFLGEVEEGRIAGITERLRAALAGTRAFSVRIAGCGSFGRPVRVVWLGVREGQEALVNVMRVVQEALADVRKDEFAPAAHLTLGRVNGSAGGLEEAVAQLREAEIGEFAVRDVLLKKSTLTPSGPVYATVAKIALEGT